jgi:hypothetical protein
MTRDDPSFDLPAYLKQMAQWEEENWLEVERWARVLRAVCIPTLAKGRPYSTFVVAAADSYAPGHERADYVCTGTADHDTINEAIAAVAAESMGGRVLLLEGNYEIDTDEVTVPDGVTLAGLGREVTRVNVSGSGVGFVFDGGVLEDMEVAVTGGSGWSVSGGTAVIRRVDFTTSGGG